MALTKLSLDQQDSRIFNTVALMVAGTKLNVGERVRTLGHASIDGGGGNDYEIVAAGTGTHDNGSYIDLTGSGFQAKCLFTYGVSTKAWGLPTGGDDYTRLQSFFDYCDTNSVTKSEILGSMQTSQGLVWIGNNILSSCKIDCYITATQAMATVLTMTSLRYCYFDGMLNVSGHGGTTYTNRTCNNGIIISDVSRSIFEYINVRDVIEWGVIIDNSAGGGNNLVEFGQVKTNYCGTRDVTGTNAETGNWSSIVNSGSSGSASQRSTISVDSIPSFIAVDGVLIINSEIYAIMAIDTGAGTVDVYPWIDNTIGSTGVLAYVVGGGLHIYGADSGIITINHRDSASNAIGTRMSSLYSPIISGHVSQGDMIGLLHGKDIASANKGGSIDGFYNEGTTLFNYVKLTSDTVSGLAIRGSYTANNFDMPKYLQIGPRLTSNGFGASGTTIKGVSIQFPTGVFESKQTSQNSKGSTQNVYLYDKDPTFWVVNNSNLNW